MRRINYTAKCLEICGFLWQHYKELHYKLQDKNILEPRIRP